MSCLPPTTQEAPSGLPSTLERETPALFPGDLSLQEAQPKGRAGVFLRPLGVVEHVLQVAHDVGLVLVDARLLEGHLPRRLRDRVPRLDSDLLQPADLPLDRRSDLRDLVADPRHDALD